MKYIYYSLVAFVFLLVQTASAQGNTYCADSQTSSVSGTCALCGVSNAKQAVDGNPGTYSTLQTTLGLLGTEVSQVLEFPNTGDADDIITLVVEDPSGLLNLTLGGNLAVESYLGNVANGDAVTINSGVASAISGTSRYLVEVPAGASFDRVKVTLSSGVLGADLSSIRIYSVCYTENDFPPVCISPVSQTSGTGGLCLGCDVDNGARAIDGDETTYSELDLTLGVGGSVFQTFNFSSASCVGEEVKMIIENPGGLLSVALLGNMSIELLDNSGTSVGTTALNYNNLELLSGGSRYIYRFAPSASYSRIRVRLQGGLVGALGGLRIYELCRNRVAPPVPQSVDQDVCIQHSASLLASSAPGTTINWYDAATGGNLLATGNTYNTPILNANRTYYLETSVDSSGCTSPSRSVLNVHVIPEAPAPVIAQASYTLYEGDDIQIVPGPIGNEFNFYADKNGSVFIATGTSIMVNNVTSDTTIYVQTNLSGCLSATTDSVVINTIPKPDDPDAPGSGESYCADSTSTGVAGICAQCGVFNAENAVDGNDNTFSTLQTTLGLLGAEVSQMLLFPEAGSSGDIITLVVEDPGSLLGASVGSNLEIETYDGASPNGDAFTVTTGTLSLISGTSRYILEFHASHDFDRLEVRLGGGVVGSDLSSIRIYSACHHGNDFPEVCMIPSNQSTSVSGILCLACNVSNPVNAIDGDETTFSQLNVTLGVAGTVSQTYEYAQPGCTGEGVSMIIENPGGLLSAALLGNVSVELLDASNAVVATEPIAFNALELLSSSNKYLFRFTPSVSYAKIRVNLNGGLVGALSGIRVYEICRNAVSAPLPATDTVLACESNPAILRAYGPAGSTVSWWDSETGGNQVSTGLLFTTPSLTNDIIYYLETTVDSSGCKSPSRSSVYVDVVPEAPAPVISQSSYTVYEGDGVTLNPGPSNVDFNFYSDRNGSHVLSTGTSYTVDSIFTDTTIYIQTNLHGCLSTVTDSVKIQVVSRPDPNDTSQTASYCADSTISDVLGICAQCGVFNAENAVDGNDNTYSSIQTTLGLLGTEVHQDLLFSTAGKAGDVITLVVEDPNGLLSATVGSNLSVSTYQGTTANGDGLTVSSGVLGAISGTNKFLIEFTAGSSFDRVRINLASGVLGVDVSSIRLYSACYRSGDFEPVCNIAVNQSSQTSGLCIGCNVTNGIGAIDGDETTYSQLNLTLGVAGSVSQTFDYGSNSCVGEGIKLTIENPGGLLSVALLGNVEVEFLDASNNVLETGSIGFSDLQLLGSSTKYLYRYAPSQAFSRMRIRLEGGLVGALSGLRIYEACRSQVAPPLPVQDTVLVCDGNSVTLHAQSSVGSTISWWDAETGGTELGTGEFYTTSVLTSDITYYLETTVDSSGCKSPSRSSVYVDVVPEAPAPAISQSSYTVYEGDDVSINPGPANVKFNFYSDRNGTVILGTGSSYSIDSATADQTIYIQTNLQGCLSNVIDSVMINVLSDPDPNDSTPVVSYCADSTIVNTSGICALCSVFDPENAVDGNDNTYSTIQTALGLPGSDVSQTLIFPNMGVSGNIISLVVEDPAGLLALTLGGNLQVETFLGSTSNNDEFTVTSGMLSVLGGTGKYLIEFTVNSDFDRVRLKLSQGIVGVDLGAIRVYSACFRNDLIDPICMNPGSEAGISSTLCIGCNVADGSNAIDGNESTYSQLNVVLGITGYVSQEFTFNEESCLGEEVKLILENPGGVLSVSLLGQVQLLFKDMSGSVVATEGISFSDLQLLSGSNKYLYTFASSSTFRKLEVRLNSGLIGALSGLRIYEVCRNAIAPPAPFSDTVNVCDGNSIVLQAVGPDSTTISWWNTATGGTKLATGPNFTTPVLHTDVTYYLESVVDSSGCISPFRNPVYVRVQPAAPAPVITMDTMGVCTGDSVVITPGPAGSLFNFYSDREGTTILASSQASYTLQNATSDSYIYIQTNLNGCLSDVVDSVLIDAGNNPLSPVFSSDSAYVCEGSDITLDIPNPDAGLTYFWYDTIAGGTPISTGTSYTVTNVSASQDFYVESRKGTCASTSRTQVSVIPVISPDVSISSGDTANVCNGSDAILRASSVVTDSIKWYDAPAGGNLLGGGSPFTYMTNPNDTVTIYAAAYLEAGGCESDTRAPVVIITGDKLDIDIAEDSLIICSGDSAVLRGISTSSGVTFSWYDSPSGGNLLFTGDEYKFSPSTNTTFYLEASTASCTNTDRVSASVYLVDSLATPSVNDISICSGTSAELYVTRHISGGLVEWYDAPTGGNLVGRGDTIHTSVLMSSTTFYVSINLGMTCNDLSRVPLNVDVLPRPLPTDVVVNDTTICIGSSVDLTASSADPRHTFSWYDAASGGNLLATGSTFQTPVLNATTEYYVEISIGGNCSSASRERVRVTTVSQPDLNLITDSLVACDGDMVTLLATSNSSSATIRWYSAPTGGSLLFTGGSYEVQVNSDTLIVYVEAGVGGCTSGMRREAKVYNLNNLATPVVNDTTVCSGNSVSLTANSNLAGATPRWWDAPTGGNLLATAITYNTPNLTSTTTYYVDLNLGSAVCPDLGRTPVTVNVVDELARPVVSCQTVTANSITFAWSAVAGASSYEVSLDSGATFVPANTPPTSHSVSGLSVGQSRTIIVRAVGSVPCQTSEASFPVTCVTNNCPPITADYLDDIEICEGEQGVITLNNISIANYGVIFNGNVSQDTVFMVSPGRDTSYTIVIFNAGMTGCDSLIATIDVTVNPKPQASFQIIRLDSNYTGTFINTFRFIPNVPGAVSWFWEFGDGTTSIVNSPVHDYANEGKYDVSLRVTNSYGCSDSITIDDAAWVRMVPEFFIPNTFTPDGDGINDIFNVLGDNIDLEELRIFNPYGNQVFSTDDLSSGWDGTFRGIKQPPGVYTYMLIVTRPNGNRIARNGTVTLIR